MANCPECRIVYGDEVQTCPEHGCPLVPDDLFLPVEVFLEPGTMVGEYRIQKKLGSGTFGDVYAGEHPLIGKKVAVKILNQRFASDPVAISRFIAEARAVNKIRQRNIIDIFSFGILASENRNYFVMELLDGLTLGELLDREGRLSMATALPIIRGIADALDAVHEAGITHRDLKPDNVFLARERDGSYFPKLLDFGIAKLIGDDVAHRTGPGMVLGTPRYMSPEQARGKPADHRADVYALGVMIHEMLTGEAPFTGQSSVDVLLKHTTDPPPLLSEVCSDLPRELDGPLLAMLQKRPKDRPASAGEAVRALIERAQKLGLEKRETTSSGVPSADPPTVPTDSDAVWSNPTVASGPIVPSGESPSLDPREESAPSPRAAADQRSTAVSGESAPGNGTDPPRSPATAPSGRLGPSTEELSVIETDSAITRIGWSRRVKVAVAAAGALAVGFSIWALGHREQASGPVSSAPMALISSSAPTPTAPAPARIEPEVKPSEALPAVVELRLTTHPEGAEVWLGDRRLGASAEPVMLPRGSERLELRLKKTGFKDEALGVTPDRNQALEVNLSPLAGHRENSPAGKPPPGTGKLDRILGDRE